MYFALVFFFIYEAYADSHNFVINVQKKMGYRLQRENP